MDEVTGLCAGCARTANEIAIWRGAFPNVRQAIWAQLPARRAQLGIRIHRLCWAQPDIQAFVAQTLKCRSGTWVFGVYGAVAEFSIAPEEPAEISVNRDSIAASTTHGAVRF